MSTIEPHNSDTSATSAAGYYTFSNCSSYHTSVYSRIYVPIEEKPRDPPKIITRKWLQFIVLNGFKYALSTKDKNKKQTIPYNQYLEIIRTRNNI